MFAVGQLTPLLRAAKIGEAWGSLDGTRNRKGTRTSPRTAVTPFGLTPAFVRSGALAEVDEELDLFICHIHITAGHRSAGRVE